MTRLLHRIGESLPGSTPGQRKATNLCRILERMLSPLPAPSR